VLGAPEEITRAALSPPPVRAKVSLRYKGRPFVALPFEMAAAEGRSTEAPERLPSAVELSPVQLEGLLGRSCRSATRSPRSCTPAPRT
jgi:hypothetical protein